jgi:acyl carrier protein
MAQTDSGVSVRERVIRVLAETQHIEPPTIQPESTFEALGIDSFDGINILFAIESEFDISVPDDEAKKLRGVQDIIDGVEKLLNARASAARQ